MLTVTGHAMAPYGTRVGISSKGGKGAKASVKNIQDAIEKASRIKSTSFHCSKCYKHSTKQ